MPLEPRASWFSPKCVEAQQLTGHLGVKHCFGAGRESGTKSRQTLNTRYDLKITGVKVGQGAFRLRGKPRASSGGRSGSENVGLSNANIGENPMPRKPKGSSARFVHGGVRRGRENASSQCSSTRRYGAEVTHAILPGKARTTFKQKGTCTRNRHRWCRKVKEVGDLMTGEPATEAPVNGGRNYNGPKVAKFLVGLGGRRRRPPSGGPEPSASQKVTEACKGFLGPDGDWPSSAKAEGSLTARPTRRAGTKVGLSDPTVPSGRAVAQRIKVTLGITG
ncbi:UNVERIFIED_CONTAM: hypothetical protein Sindi_2989400 [Sesamum indicum]